MKHFKVNKIVWVFGVIALMGISANAFAGWGKGRHHGPGWHRGGWGMGAPGYGYNLSDEEIKALEQERRAFFNETEALRQDLYAKDLELRSELAKENIDAQKAAQLQKEISRLESQLNQMRIDHIIKMRKISPRIGFGRGFRGHGRMGYGPRNGGGYCWR